MYCDASIKEFTEEEIIIKTVLREYNGIVKEILKNLKSIRKSIEFNLCLFYIILKWTSTNHRLYLEQ